MYMSLSSGLVSVPFAQLSTQSAWKVREGLHNPLQVLVAFMKQLMVAMLGWRRREGLMTPLSLTDAFYTLLTSAIEINEVVLNILHIQLSKH